MKLLLGLTISAFLGAVAGLFLPRRDQPPRPAPWDASAMVRRNRARLLAMPIADPANPTTGPAPTPARTERTQPPPDTI